MNNAIQNGSKWYYFRALSFNPAATNADIPKSTTVIPSGFIIQKRSAIFISDTTVTGHGERAMDIGNQIRKRRTELHMTQEELAEKLSVVRTAVSNWEVSIRDSSDKEVFSISLPQ